MGHSSPFYLLNNSNQKEGMDTFRQELISYHCDQKRLKWLQGQVDKLKFELNKQAGKICNHTDAAKGQALLVMPDLESGIEQDVEPFAVYILPIESWSKKLDQTQNLRVETLTEIKTQRSHPPVDGSTPESEIPA